MFKKFLICCLLLVEVSSAGAENLTPQSGSEPAIDSIYSASELWTSSEEKKIRLGSFSGKPVLIALVYTRCRSICPTIVNTMKQVESKYGSKLQYVLVTLDSDRDTPPELAAFAVRRGLRSPPWTLLTGPEDQTRELSVVLQVKQAGTADGEFIHTNVIIVLDSEGRIIGGQPGGSDVDSFRPLIDPLVGNDKVNNGKSEH